MAVLSSPQKEAYVAFRQKSVEAWKAKKSEESIQYCLKAWEAIPEPRTSFDESYQIVKNIIFLYMQTGNYVEAKKWSEILYSCDPERIDSGDRDFIAGTIAHAMKDTNEAFRFFKLAFEKSEGRIFEGEDPKYKKFFEQNS
jgi:hypothetical protein